MDTSFLKDTQLFHGIKEKEIKEICGYLRPHERKYHKYELIFRAGSSVKEFCIIKSGSVNVVVNLYWGKSIIFGHFSKGDIFAESYAVIPGKELMCDVVACEDTEIIFINMNDLFTIFQTKRDYHKSIIHNMLQISAQKNLAMSSRMIHIASNSLRERLMSYFSEQALKHGSSHFTIPFNRQQLADYLSVNRSAMSKELSKMRDDGLIVYHRNEFTLKRFID